MKLIFFILAELIRALTVLICAAFGLEFLKEGLVSDALDLHKVVFATVGLYIVELLLKRIRVRTPEPS